MDTPPTTLHILGQFRLVQEGELRTCSPSAQRVIALLAVRGGLASREIVAGTLWPDTPPARAAARLRTALWRAGIDVPGLVETKGDFIRVRDSCWIDYHVARSIGRELTDGTYTDEPARPLVDLFAKQLLTGWYEEWLTLEREFYREVQVHALEALARTFLDLDMNYLAIMCCLESISIDAYRDSTHSLLARAYAAEGNAAAALRHLREYREMISRELGVLPGPLLSQLEAELCGSTGRHL